MAKNKKFFDSLPERAIDALKLWDEGASLWSVEMGGGALGPSYEQCIQVSVFELIRELKGKAPDGRKARKILNAALMKIDKKYDLGHSGATAGAAMHLAYRFLKNGYRKTLQEAPDNRLIQIDNNFPRIKRSKK